MKTIDDIAQDEFGMNYDQLGEKEKEWVDDECEKDFIEDLENDDHYERNYER